MREVQARFETPDGQPLRGRVRLRLIASVDDPGAGHAAGDEVIVTGVAEPILDDGWLRAADGGPLLLRPTDGATNPAADPDAITSPDRTVWELTVDPDGQPDHLRLFFDLPSGSTPVQVWDVLTDPPSGLVAPHSHPAPDHGALTGLGDDDHPQYLPVAGGRSADTLTVTGDLTVGGRVFGGPEVAATSSDPLPGDVRLIAAGRVLRIRERSADIDPDAKEANLGLWTVEPDVDGELVVIDRGARFGGLRRRLFVRDLTASRALAVTDLGSLIAGSGVTLTVPDDATLRGPLPADWLVPGVFVDLLQTGPAPLVVEAGAGVTLVGSGAGRISLGWEGASARLIRLGTDRWAVMGQTAAAAAGLQQIVRGRWTTVPWGTGATGSINPALDELVVVPLPTRGGTVDAVAVERMGSTQTGCRIRIGVYGSTGGMPGRLIAELGSWLVEAVTVHTLTLASPVTLPPGRLWLACVVQGAAAAFRGWTAAASYSGAPAGAPSFQVDGLARFGSVSGALPSSLEGATWAERNTSIVVHLRGGG